MKRWIFILIVVGTILLSATAFGAAREIVNRDGDISINADEVPLRGSLIPLPQLGPSARSGL
jgi:hypothetical protein